MLCDLSKNLNMQQKGLEDFSVKLTEAVYSTFSGVRAAYAVRSTAIGKEQDQDMDYFPRLLELASGRCRRLFTSKQIQELESMMRNIGLYLKSEPCSTMAVSQASSETLEAKDPNVGDSEVITHTNAEPGIKSESASEIGSNAAILKMNDPEHVRDMSTAPVSCLGIMGNIPESSNPGDVVIMNKVPETSAVLSGIDTSTNCTEITSDDDVRSFQAEHVSHPCSDKNVADPLSAASLYCEKFACKPHLYTRLPSPTPEEKEDAQTECQEGDIVRTAQSNALLEKLEQDSAPFPVSYRDLNENKQQTDTASHAEGRSIPDFGLLSYPDIVQSQSGGSSQLSRNAGADIECSQTSVKAAANEFGTKMSQTSMLLASKITGIEGPKALGVTKQDEGHMKSRDPRRILRGRQAYPDVWVADPENQPADLSSLVFGLELVGGSRKREREGDIDQENRLVKRQHKDEKLSLQDALIGPPNLPGGRHAEDNKFVEALSEGSTDMEIDSLDSSQQLRGAGNSDETNSKNENFASIFVGEVIVPRKKQKIREIPDLNQECAEAISSNDSGYLNAGNWVAQNTSVVSMQPSAYIDPSKIGNTLKPRMKLRDPRRALLETTEDKVKNVDRGPPKVDESMAINFKPSSDTVRAETIFVEPASSLPLEHSLLTLSKEKTLRHGNKVEFWGNDKPNGHDSPLLLVNGVSSPLKGNQLKDDAVPSGLNSSRVDGHIDLTQECGIVGDMILTRSRSKPRSNKSRSSKHYPSKVSEGFKCWENLEVFEGLDEEEREAVYQERARRIEEQNRMLNARKLCLVLDLDHTLLNSAKFTEIDEEWEALLHANEAAERKKVDDNGVSRRELYRFPHMGMWTKLRPGVWDFLSRASELFELHVYTMGNKAYATEMAKLLDPTGTLFAGRVISKGDDGDTFDDDGRLPKSKDLDGVLGMESAVIIIDDSVRVWPHHRHNLIVVERYMYFPSSRRQFGLPGLSLLEIKHDERETDGMLASVLSVIEDIHHTFFANKWIHEVDVRRILAAVKQNVLAGCKILFSRVFPQGESLPHLHPLWQTAEHFGATCTTTLDEDITHVVAMSRGTDKVKWATSTGRFSVSPAWLEASAVLYRRANEFDFPVPQ